MKNQAPDYCWAHLTPLQVGRYAEHFVVMELVRYGFDVYRCEVDDRGIDFVIRHEGSYTDLQVKAVRDGGYIFFRKDNFQPRPNLVAAIVILSEGKLPELFLLPSTLWAQPNGVFVSRDYDKPGLKSRPEWGLSVSEKTLPVLRECRMKTLKKAG